MSALRHVQVASEDAHGRGRQYGERAGELIAASIEVYRETFAYYAELDWSRVRTLAAEFRDPIAAHDDQIMAEMDGIAAGAGLDPEDILAINARTEIMFGLGSKVAPPECTAFFVGPQASADGHVLIGQNWDWRTRCAETTILVEVDQGPGRPAFVMLVEAGLIGKLGFNSAGVGVATNALVSELDRGRPGIPYHVLLRMLLNAPTLEAARAAILASDRSASANYLVGSADGRAFDAETAPGGADTAFFTELGEGVLAHTNHFTCAPAFADVGGQNWPDSTVRMDRMGALLAERSGELTPRLLAERLRDHEGFPNSLCRHPDPDAPSVEQAMTVASWIVDLTERVALAAGGPPCEESFEPVTPQFARDPSVRFEP